MATAIVQAMIISVAWAETMSGVTGASAVATPALSTALLMISVDRADSTNFYMVDTLMCF